MTVSRDGRACDVWDPSNCEGNPHCPPRCPRFVDRCGLGWLVRPYEPDDREPLLDAYAEFDDEYRAQGLPPRSDTVLRDWLDALVDDGCNVVASRDGLVAGHAVYTPTDAAEPELAVFVRPAFQRRGLGTELCKHVIAAAAAGGRDALVLEVVPSNRPAIRIYERLGFERVDPGSPGVGRRSRSFQMRLSLSPAVGNAVQRPPALSG